MEEQIINLFNNAKENNPNASLDELLYEVYESIKKEGESYSEVKPIIIKALGIDEYDYYTKGVSKELKKYIETAYFPEYDKNDRGHGIIHIIEVIRRAFALNDTFKLRLDSNMLFAIAACHDIGKYIDHETHEKIAAAHFYDDENMKRFFSDEQRTTIKEAIEDHRSSKEDEPRTVYGKIISSADRNTTIDIVFIRSFFVAHERTPEMIIEEYLEYTINRLRKRYSEENPENMFFEDETYRVFLKDMRDLLQKDEEFKTRYCEINHIKDRTNLVQDEPGRTEYANSITRKRA